MDSGVQVTPGGLNVPEKLHMMIPVADRAIPPGGPRHRSRVRRVESGKRLQFSAVRGERLREENVPGPPDAANWIAYAGWMNNTGNAITRLSTTWTIPPAPANQASQLLYFFDGIETADGQIIVQPVLQWGDSGADEDGQNRTGPYWTVASWIVGGPDGMATHTPHIRVDSGDVVTGVVALTDQSDLGFVYNCEFQGLAGTILPTPRIPQLVWCVETLEAYELQGEHTPPYDLDAASEYPAGRLSFNNIEIVTNAPGPGGAWDSKDVVTQYGENAYVAANTTTNGEVIISF